MYRNIDRNDTKLYVVPSCGFQVAFFSHKSISIVISEIGQSSRNYCELSGRSQPVIGDVIVALINAGISIQGLDTFARRESRAILQPPQQISSTKQLSLLQAGTKNSHPSHIPNHLPVLPDPHAYIRTPVC